MSRRLNKKSASLDGWCALSQVEKLSFSFFGHSYFNRLCKTFQGSTKDKKEIHTVNNNVYFVPKFGTFQSFNA